MGSGCRFYGSGIDENIFKMNPLIVFLHIPKCGGTTFGGATKLKNDIMSRNFKTIRYPSGKIPDGGWDSVKGISGHYNYDLVIDSKHFEGRKKIYFTFLRDPVHRLMSFYYFVEHEDSIEKWLNLHKQNLQNRMVNYLASCQKLPTIHDLEKAKDLLTKINFGITDQFDSSLKLFKYNFPNIFQDISYEKLNVTKKKYRYDMHSDRIKSMLQEYNTLDLELYKFAKDLFKKRLKEMKNV